MNLGALPCEIVSEIALFTIDPYSLVGSLAKLRHINRWWFAATERNEFWIDLVATLRPSESLQDLNDFDEYLQASVPRPEMAAANPPIDEEEEDSEDEQEPVNRFFRTHSFIDNLLTNTHRNKFYFLDLDNIPRSDQFISYKKQSDGSSSSEDAKPQETTCSILYEKVDEWIEAFTHHPDSILLRALLEISLGHEMIEFWGMGKVGCCVQAFFHHLFMPCMLKVRGWLEGEEKESTMDVTQMLDGSLIQFLMWAKNGRTIFGQSIGKKWNELDMYYFTIPRQYLLLVMEHFSGMKTAAGHDLITSVFDTLWKCGIHIEDIMFIDHHLMKTNFERTPYWKNILPECSSNLFMQHLAVFTRNYQLLHWCLTVNDKLSDTKMVHIIPCEWFSEELTVRTHMRTTLTDIFGMTILHYAVAMRDFEMVKLCLERYGCNPFMPSRLAGNAYSLAMRNASLVGKTRWNDEERIVELLKLHFGKLGTDYRIDFPSEDEHDIKDTRKRNDDLKIHLLKKGAECHINEELYHSPKTYTLPDAECKMNSNLVIENSVGLNEEYDCYSDESDSEEAISLQWMQDRVSQMKNEMCTDGDNNSLKRKRYDPYYQQFGHFESFQEEVKEALKNFEHDSVQHDRAITEPTQVEVKLLNRKWKKARMDDRLGNEFITDRSKLSFTKHLTHEMVMEQHRIQITEGINTPHALLLIQQHMEDFMQKIFKFANSMALMISQDFVPPQFIALAQAFFMNNHFSSRRPFQSFVGFQDVYLFYKIYIGSVWIVNPEDFSVVSQQAQSLMCFLNALCEENDVMQVFEAIFQIVNNEVLMEENEDEAPHYPDHISTCSSDSVSSGTALFIAGGHAEQIYTHSAQDKMEELEQVVGWDGKERFIQTEIHEQSLHHYVFTQDRDLGRLWNYEYSSNNRFRNQDTEPVTLTKEAAFLETSQKSSSDVPPTTGMK